MFSLRNRLLALILTPMIVVAVASTLVRYQLARQTSSELYDNTLLAVATTISRDIAISQGDVLAENLVNLLADSLGDSFFYHYNAPLSAFVTGYSNPPMLPAGFDTKGPTFFDAEFLGRPVRVVTMREVTYDTADQTATITVWQTTAQREKLSLELAQGAAAMLGLLLAIGGLVVWFGINFGLRPLLDLRDAVRRRSPVDLKPIQRPVPREIVDLVSALNGLFNRLADAFAARDVFISNAAHQLRNPIAGLLAQAQAAAKAKSSEEREFRIAGVVEAARRAARLTSQLLSMERLRADPAAFRFDDVDLTETAANIASAYASRLVGVNADLSFDVKGTPRHVRGDQVLISEALENLLDNAAKYGCRNGGNVEVGLVFGENAATISVADDGPGVPGHEKESIFDRFYRGSETLSHGSGLGLSIVREIAERHGGTAVLAASKAGARFEITLPYGSAQNR